MRALDGIPNEVAAKRREVAAALVRCGFPEDYAAKAAEDIADDWINAQLQGQWYGPIWQYPGYCAPEDE